MAAAPNTGGSKRNVMAIGNPGCGKSSTINSWCGEIVFDAKPSLGGTGITFQLDVKEWGDKTFLDTPGLSDLKLRREAAIAISDALRKGGEFNIFFCTREDEGRIRSDDLTTMRLVFDACNGQVMENDYAMMVNMCDEDWLELMTEEHRKEWTDNWNEACERMGIPTTTHIFFAPRIKALNKKTNALVKFDAEMLSFLDNMPLMRIDGANIEDVDYESFEKIKEKVTELKQQLIADKASHEQQLRAEQARYEQALADAKEQQERLRAEIDEVHKQQVQKITAEHARAQVRIAEENRQRDEAAALRLAEEVAKAKSDQDRHALELQRAETAKQEAVEREQQLQASKEALTKRLADVEAGRQKKQADLEQQQLEREREVAARNAFATLVECNHWCNMNLTGSFTCATIGAVVRRTQGAAYVKVWKGQSRVTSIVTLGITVSKVHGYWIYDANGRMLAQDHQLNMMDYRKSTDNEYIWIGHLGGRGVGAGPANVILDVESAFHPKK